MYPLIPQTERAVNVIVGIGMERDNQDSNSTVTVIQVSCAVLEATLSMKS